jgi:hypothetical protein
LKRGHQDKLTLLKQEMSVISETLEQQRRILDFFQLLGRGQSTSARKQYREAAAKRTAEHRKSAKHALGLRILLTTPMKTTTMTLAIPEQDTIPGTSM